MHVTVDTSALLGNLEGIKLKRGEWNLIIPFAVLHELDGLKENAGKSSKARKAINYINEEIFDEVQFYNTTFSSPTAKADDKIVYAARETESSLYSMDVMMQIKAKILGVPLTDTEVVQEEKYTGYIEVTGGTDVINQFYTDFDDGKYEFKENQYICLHDTSRDQHTEHKFVDGKLTHLVLPDSRTIKGLNNKQRCALDLLFNKDVPIKIIQGIFGSGKTLLSVRTAIHMIEDKGWYQKMLLVRNPICADGADIGFLPGTKEEKTIDFMKPMLQYIGNDEQIDNMSKYDKIDMEVVGFMKGINVDNTIMLVDEAEDLNRKLIKLIGTRVGKGSGVVFMGDYKQAEAKYRKENGMSQFIDTCAGNKLVGIITLDTDVRSSASKVFADF
jgi:predicted ribonuclease YlaK